MTDSKTPPTLGVALTVAELEDNLDLVRDHERDVELQDFGPPDGITGDWRPAADKAVALLQGHEGRLGIHGPFWGFSLSTTDPDVSAIVKRRLDQALDITEHLGGTHVVVHSPVGIWDCHQFPVQPRDFQRKMEAFQANVSDAVTRAASLGCQLVLENIEDIDPYVRFGLIAALDPKGIALSIDTGHASYVHKMHRAPPVDAFVHAAGPRLGHMHLHDNDGNADRHWCPGTGTIAWHAVFDALHQSTSIDTDEPDRPRLLLELRNKRLLRPAIDYFTGRGLAV